MSETTQISLVHQTHNIPSFTALPPPVSLHLPLLPLPAHPPSSMLHFRELVLPMYSHESELSLEHRPHATTRIHIYINVYFTPSMKAF